jgi:transcription-repair coupling factor (superfamily II helicase)
MTDFASGKIDVLVCTTIIESGLDMPNANTLIVNKSDKFGLTQLYQLRGRVGRGANLAYAYFLYDKGQRLSPVAHQRLRTIYEATELGAGMQIALRDLEIRGAGNLLGSEQSGHMAAVGFDLYIRLLGEAVERLKALQRGETPPPPLSSRPAITLDLPLTAHLPVAYIPDLNLRLAVYQRLSQAQDDAEAAAIEQELRDRFGELPAAARNLLWVVRLRILAAAAGVGAVQTEGEHLVIRLLPGRELDRGAVARRLASGSTVLSHQVRLSRDGAGGPWREALVRALAAISEAVKVPA